MARYVGKTSEGRQVEINRQKVTHVVENEDGSATYYFVGGTTVTLQGKQKGKSRTRPEKTRTD